MKHTFIFDAKYQKDERYTMKLKVTTYKPLREVVDRLIEEYPDLEIDLKNAKMFVEMEM